MRHELSSISDEWISHAPTVYSLIRCVVFLVVGLVTFPHIDERLGLAVEYLVA